MCPKPNFTEMEVFGVKKILATMLALTCLFGLFGCGATTAKDPEDMTAYLSKELDIEQSKIQYAGEYIDGEDALVWFVAEREYTNQYFSVSCRVNKNQTYHINEIHKADEYTTDIVHSLWDTHDVYLINNLDCTKIVLKNGADEIVSQIDITADEFPYIFDLQSFGNGKIMFMNSNGEEIR